MHLGDVVAGSTLYIPFASYNSAGASATLSGLAATDIEIFKNGAATTRASDAGYALLDTDGIDFASVTGVNGFSVDLSNNTDAGFYAVGSFYWIVVSAVTIDSQTVNLIAATFKIVSDMTPATIADAVWDEEAAGHQTAGTFGQTIGDSADEDGLSLQEITSDLVNNLSNVSSDVDSVNIAVGSLPSDAAQAVLAANFEQDGEAGVTVAEGLRITVAALSGKLSGAGTGTETVRNVLDTKNRLVYTVDTDGNRSVVTRDLT
jgi:hypothetical protein